ncbi:hypothetical protein J2Y02_004619 [Neobacillus drentensis]|nr:hypothetical protein [Neobacillus drentensis]
MNDLDLNTIITQIPIVIFLFTKFNSFPSTRSLLNLSKSN